MYRFYLFALLLFTASCNSPSVLPEGGYYGRLKTDHGTYPLYLNYQPSGQSTLTIISFRGYGIPLDTLFFKSDSLHFTHRDSFEKYAGYFDRSTGDITGNWIFGDSVFQPLTFT